MPVNKDRLDYIHHISAFDLDRTLVGVTTCALFFKKLIKIGFYSKTSVARALWYQTLHQYFDLPLEALHKKLFEHFILGHSSLELQLLAYDFIHQHIEKLLYPPTLLRLRYAQHMGHYTVILSNSPDFIVQPVAKILGCDDYRATRYKAVDGYYVSIEEIMECDNKAKHLDQLLKKFNLGMQDVTTYSDSILDLPFLMKSTAPVAVNPDRKLKTIFLEHGWDII